MRLARVATLTIVTLLLTACSRATSDSLQAGVLYQDTLDADNGNWWLESDMDANATFADGQLQLEIASPNLIAWSELLDREFGDFVLEVDASQLGGPDDNSYGVVFRVENPNAYYSFDISGDGYFAVRRRDESDGGSWTRLTEDWLASNAIHQGASTNRITIIARRSQFSFYVNEQLVAEVVDSNYSSGAIGLNAGSFHEPGVRIGFDNLTITQPE